MRAGFSLVEVTLAIGVVSFALLSAVGTISIGLLNIRDSKQDTEHAQVVTQMASIAMQAPFDQLENVAAAGPYFFTQSGRRVNSSDEALYRAKLTVKPGDETFYPGAPEDLNSSAKIIEVTVTDIRKEQAEARTCFIVPKF